MPEASAPSPVCKVRLRFAKHGDLRLLSHHDLMRLLERLLRRAGLPFRSTGGFHPKPKITFASALSLGIVGRQEVVEIEFDGELDTDCVLAELQVLAPDGLSFLSAKLVSPRNTAQAVRAVYHFPLPPEAWSDLAAKADELLSQTSLVISRTRTVPLRPAQEEPLAEERLDALTNAEPVQTKLELKKLDIRPFLKRLWRDEQGFWMDVSITNQGAARPEELLRLVDLEESWLDGDAVLERVVLEIEDEVESYSRSPNVDAVSSPGPQVQDPPSQSQTATTAPMFPKGKCALPPTITLPRKGGGNQTLPRKGGGNQTLPSMGGGNQTPDSSETPPVTTGPTEKV